MSYPELLTSYLPTLLGSIPMLVAWLVGIILATVMTVREGGKAQYLLLSGCSLMLVAQIARPFLMGLAAWLVTEHGLTAAGAAGLAFSLPESILNMAGIVCLVLAFWTRWRTSETAE